MPWRLGWQRAVFAILAGWPAGHCKPNYPLPIHVEVLLDADAQRLTVI